MTRVLPAVRKAPGCAAHASTILRSREGSSALGRWSRSLALWGAITAPAGVAWAQPAAEPGEESVEISDLSMQDLLDPNVTTASRLSEKATEAPATVYVVTKEDI